MSKSPLLDKETDLISVEVSIDGSALGEEYHVVFVEIEKNINKLPYAMIEILDGDPSKQKLEALEKKKFEPGQDVIVKAGYHQKMEVVFKGIVSGVGFNSKQGRHGRTQIECTDKCIGLTLTMDNEFFPEKTDSAIVQQIVGTYDGITCEADSTETNHKKMVQYNASDWDFILSRAQSCERIVVADENILKFKKPGGNVDVELEYGTDIIKLDLNVDARNQRKEIEIKGWNPSTHEFKTGSSAEPSYVDKQGSDALKGDKLADKMQFKKETIYAPSTLETSELRDIAKSKLLHSRLSRVKGKIILQGFTDVKINSFVKLTKTNENYDGDIYITGLKHTIEEGNFITEATVGLDPESFEGEASKKGSTPDNLGLMPGPKGLFIGEITQMDGDPEQDFRVQVKIPSFHEDDPGLWARMSGPSASENSGFIWYPEVGDQVVVGFLMNDPRFPIVLGSLYSSTHGVFDDHQPAAGNNQKALVTREHMKILFEEDKKDITITTPGEQQIMLRDSDRTIELSDSHGNKITMDSSGIKIDSPGDIIISATGNVDISAVRNFSASGVQLDLTASGGGTFNGGPTLELKSNGATDLKGSMTSVNGSVMLRLN